MAGRWIVIRNWPDYQHYHDRDPNWIKDHRSQHSEGDYLNLSFHLRGILKDLRLLYAATAGQLSDNTATLTRQLGHRVMTRDLESLNHAGFIDFVASKPLALARSREKRREEKKEPRARAQPKPEERLPFNGHPEELAEPDRPRSQRTNAAAYRKHTDTPDTVPVERENLELAYGWMSKNPGRKRDAPR